MKNADDEFNARRAPLLNAISERVSNTDQLLSIVRTDPFMSGGIGGPSVIPTSPPQFVEPNLGSQLHRIFLSRLITPVVNFLRSNHYQLYDYHSEMPGDLASPLFGAYDKYLCENKNRITESWRPISLRIADAVKYSGDGFQYSGSGSFWLNEPQLLSLSGLVEARKCGNHVEYRNISIVGSWFDNVDANSFPGVSDLWDESKDVYDNGGIATPTIEGLWDLIGDGIFDTDFKVTITFLHSDSNKHDAICK